MGACGKRQNVGRADPGPALRCAARPGTRHRAEPGPDCGTAADQRQDLQLLARRTACLGVWRTTTQADYDAGGTPAWTTVLDLDRLSADENANWIWKGADCEPRAQRRCLLLLSDGGEDAVSAREFDLTTRRFVAGGFGLPKGKQRTAWLGADTLLVAREWNPGELTTSSYPYVVKTLRRGQPLSAATEVFRGSKDDVGYGVTPQVFLDAKGRRAALIVRPCPRSKSSTILSRPRGHAGSRCRARPTSKLSSTGT